MDQVRIKLSAIQDSVAGKRVVLVDDSIVRGTTSGRIVSLLREAGAREVHLRVSAPPFLNPCYYGTDIPESGTPTTTSAWTGWVWASISPARRRAAWTDTPSMTESGRAK